MSLPLGGSFPRDIARFGLRAGKPNENFLNADLFATSFLGPCEHIRLNVGLLMFEFSHFWLSDLRTDFPFASLISVWGKTQTGRDTPASTAKPVRTLCRFSMLSISTGH